MKSVFVYCEVENQKVAEIEKENDFYEKEGFSVTL